jgi:spermidine synthase
MQGIHLTADLSGCQKNLKLMSDESGLRQACLDLVTSCGLTVVGDTFVAFPGVGDSPGGVTGTILLAESHLALHTWPEQSAVTLDIYVCNFSTDNSKKASQLLDAMTAMFDPAQAHHQSLQRGEIGAAHKAQSMGQEWLNEHSAYAYQLGPVLYREQSPYQLIEVHDSPQFGRLFRLDGDYMTSEKEEFFYHEALVHPAAASHGKVASVLILGGGDGGAAEELLKYPSVKRVVIAELDEVVIRVAREYFQNIHHGALDDPRVEVRIGDGLAFVRDTSERFDLVLLDLTDPDTPASALYTSEFFSSVKKLLNPGGAMVLHTASPIFRPDIVRTLYQRIQKNFTIVAPMGLYIPLYGAYWSFAICSESLDPRNASSVHIAELIDSAKLKDLEYYNPLTHQGLFALPNYFQKLVEN